MTKTLTGYDDIMVYVKMS